MNRRDFTRSLAAAAFAPALPASALKAPALAGAKTAEHMYFMGWYTARVQNRCSPAILQEELKLTPKVASEIFGKLRANGTVTAPNAMGISRAVDPLTDRVATVKRMRHALTRDSALPDINHEREMSRHDIGETLPDSPATGPDDTDGPDRMAATGAEPTCGADDIPAADPPIRDDASRA